MATLYEITAQTKQLMDWLIEEPEDVAINDTLESLQTELEDKAEDYCKVMKMIQGEVDMLDKEIERLNEKKKQRNNAIDRLKKALFSAMQDTGISKIKGLLFNLSIRNTAPSIKSLPDIALIPDKYHIKHEDTIDKRLLLTDIKAGKVIEGVEIASGKCLVIK